MSASYTKLFSSIVTSTVWMEDSDTRIVWITMLALADKHGEVQGSVPGLARLSGVSMEACEKALHKFLTPDPHSRTEDAEGRRIEKIDGGWSLINYNKYRRMASKDEQLEKDRERKRRYRYRVAGVQNVPSCPAPSHQRDGKSTEAEEDREEDSVAKATGAGAPQFDPVKALFDDGVRLLGDTGTNERQARSLIGKWRKAHGDEATREAIQAAYDQGITMPVEWITRRLVAAGPVGESWDQRRIRRAMEAIQ